MILSKLPLLTFLPQIDESTVQTGNIIFIIFGSVCIVIGISVLLLNKKKKNRTQKIVGISFFAVGILSVINNLFQYLFWS